MELDFKAINTSVVESLTEQINAITGPKHLVVDGELLEIINRLIPKFSEFKEACNINTVYLCKTKLDKSPTDSIVQWVYIVRPNLKKMTMIINHLNNDLVMSSNNSIFKILFLPKKFYLCDILLEKAGIYENISIGEVDLYLCSLDTNLSSMEFPHFFSKCFLHGDQSWFPCVARSLIRIEKLFGSIPNVHLHGNAAKGIFELMKILKRTSKETISSECKIGHLILIDRNVDYVTPFCTSLTYEGLLDEIYGIKAGTIEIQELSVQNKAEKKMVLSNESSLFRDIRDLHFSDVSTLLINKIEELQKIEDESHEMARDITKVNEFVQTKLSKLLEEKAMLKKYLEAYNLAFEKKKTIGIKTYLEAEYSILTAKQYKFVEYIEEIIIQKVLRLMILLSVTNDGIPQADYKRLTNVFLQAYGYDRIVLLNKLQKLGLYYESETVIVKEGLGKYINRTKPTNYKYIRKKLDIIPKDPETLEPNDMSYLYNKSYRPIMCKYIEQMLLNKKSTKINKDFLEITKLLEGDYDFHRIPLPDDSSRNVRSENNEADRTVLIYFIGGVSYSEISSLKLLEKQYTYKFYYATTGFMNITSFINTLEELDE